MLFSENFENAGDFELLARMLLKNKCAYKKVPYYFVNMSFGGKSNKNINSVVKNTIEIKKALNINNLLSSYFLILMRFFIKIFQFFKN